MSWAGGVSLGVAGGAALLIIVVRLLIRTEAPVQPFVRTIADVEFEWRCELGHAFFAAGQMEPRNCWTCGRPAYPIAKFACPSHGEFEVAVQFTLDADGVTVPSLFKVIGVPRDWTPAERGPDCPRCRRKMARAPEPPQPSAPPTPVPRSERR